MLRPTSTTARHAETRRGFEEKLLHVILNWADSSLAKHRVKVLQRARNELRPTKGHKIMYNVCHMEKSMLHASRSTLSINLEKILLNCNSSNNNLDNTRSPLSIRSSLRRVPRIKSRQRKTPKESKSSSSFGNFPVLLEGCPTNHTRNYRPQRLRRSDRKRGIYP